MQPLPSASFAVFTFFLIFCADTFVGGQEKKAGKTDQYEIGLDSKPQEGTPKGTLSKSTITSAVYDGREFSYQLYVPAQYDGTTEACVMVFQDGNNWVREPGAWHLPVVFDNLIAKREMPITIGIFIDPSSPRTRADEYDTLSDRYARFVIDEVLPEVAKTYKLTTDPNRRAIAGFSSGAICAFTVAWERPDAFRKVVSFFGSFTSIGYRPATDSSPIRQGGDMYPTFIRRNSIKPIKVFFQDGSNDLNNQFGNWFLENQRMVSAIEWANANARNRSEVQYELKYEWGDGGHTAKHGGAILPDIVRWLWSDLRAER